ncbi:MAG: hypothetical protein ACRBB6_11615 [Neptuniibacter sp.]
MRRLIFLAPTSKQVEGVIASFISEGVTEDGIHVIANDLSQIENMNLRPASDVETTELENDMDWGMVAGGGLGLAAGLVASTALAPLSSIVAGGAVVAGSFLGIGLGGWLGKLVGESTPVHLLCKYKHALEQGGFLVMVDIPAERMSEIHKVIRHHCPKALVEIIHLHWDYHQAA